MKAFDVSRAARTLEERDRLHEERLDTLFEEAWADFAVITTMIVEGYSPERLYQWGSLLHREWFREYSDIDIGIEGVLHTEAVFELCGKAWDLTRFPVDVLELSKIDHARADLLRVKGRLVYDRKTGYFRPQR